MRDGLDDWELKSPIELELNAIVNGKIGGCMDIQVVNFGAKVEAEQQQKIKLSIGPKDPASEAEKKARIEKAMAEEAKNKMEKQNNIVALLDNQRYIDEKAQKHKERLNLPL